MGTKISYYRIAGASFPPWSGTESLHPYTMLDESKTTPAKRAKPIGVNLLFSGTDVSCSRRFVRRGQYSRTFFNVGAPGGSYTIGSPPAASAGSAPFGTLTFASTAANSLRKQMIDTSVSLGQALVERKQTAALFTDYGGRIIRSYSALRKGNPRAVYAALTGGNGNLPKNWKKKFRSSLTESGKHVFDVSSDTWLAWQYGVRPLVSDLSGAINAYRKARAVKPLIRSFMATPQGSSYSASHKDPSQDLRVSTVISLRGRCKCYAEFSTSADFWSTGQTLGLTNPVLLLWEIIPWSFVVDWFINVGDYLEASATIHGLVRSAVHTTSHYYEEHKTSQYGGSSSSQYTVKSRSFGSLPGPTLRISKDPFNLESGLDRTMSALALIRQPLRGMFPSKR